ncbi:MAG: hypothetical protein JRD05_00675 [Deltaproteobacteria bacterium]|nr:hypothetical protein [Deltaproteobacteria bacterium]
MTAKERAFNKKVKELIKKANSMEDAAVKRAVKLLASARKDVAAAVATTEWEAYRLPELKAAIDRTMREFGAKYGVDLRDAQMEFWNHGIDMVDAPIRKVGIYAVIPEIDMTALGIMQDFSADLVVNLGKDAARKISNEMSMGIIGQKSPYEVMQAVGRNLKDKSIFKSITARAEMITRQETGRVMEMASQARRERAAEVVPGLGKEWKHGALSKVPRISHLAADGQTRKVNEDFNVGGEELSFPRDPKGSAKNTIGCNCYSVPWHPNWDEAVKLQEAA